MASGCCVGDGEKPEPEGQQVPHVEALATERMRAEPQIASPCGLELTGAHNAAWSELTVLLGCPGPHGEKRGSTCGEGEGGEGERQGGGWLLADPEGEVRGA
eukprot:CAMPEP_0117664396 /NCGR_PEP_ID=MMETSP0804-20121206/9196_1 /TAXON_ID=1074897 /ORGANISM="Tetraselmis astigmatica, Strain CCMP880" /LENGTH=101 /DNA_ID=CAMNT_0005471623 /DNA_START=1749 /DNA_END=2055 /DNA_ORIENTATION=+